MNSSNEESFKEDRATYNKHFFINNDEKKINVESKNKLSDKSIYKDYMKKFNSFSSNYNNKDIPENYFHLINKKEKEILVNYFNSLIKTNLEKLNNVYLEGFGFLLSMSEEKPEIRDVDKDNFEVENVGRLKIFFEKCQDCNSFFKEKYKAKELQNLIKEDTKENKEILERYSLKELLQYANVFVKEMKRQTIVEGVSNLFLLGTLYAIKNRVGKNEKDWFASADIIFIQMYEKTFYKNEIKRYKKPVYKNSLEVFRTAFGEEVGNVLVNLKKELYLFGFGLEELREIKDPCLKLYVFEDRSLSEKGIITLYYVTDFLRTYGIKEYGIGTEFVFSLQIEEKDFRNQKRANIPLWPARVFAAGWLSLQDEQLRKANTNLALTYGVPLNEMIKNNFEGVFINDFLLLPSIQKAQDGLFYYKNILGVTKDEIEFAEKFSTKYVNDLLFFRNLNQTTKLTRRSIVEKTQRLPLAG